MMRPSGRPWKPISEGERSRTGRSHAATGYIEPRTVSEQLQGRAEDTRGVFAFVVDSDADKGKAGHADGASLRIETSPGNAHLWLFLDRALTTEQAMPIARAVGFRPLYLPSAFTLALQHHLPLELSHTAKDVQHQLSRRRGGVDSEVDDA